ncbi:4Fe-4S binding protein [Lachnospiraceae bacterium ZAX-1]
MKAKEHLAFLTYEIHSTVFATVDENGYPHTCVIDIMLCDDSSIYFLTATGKSFYDRLKKQHYVSITGMKGEDTLSTVVISIRGKIRELGNGLVEKVFKQNPYMNKIYPKLGSHKILTVFQLYEGEGEFFDLRQQPPFHEPFSFGGATVMETGYKILRSCKQCGDCLATCPADCIVKGNPFSIREENCIHCGNCFTTCKYEAIVKR